MSQFDISKDWDPEVQDKKYRLMLKDTESVREKQKEMFIKDHRLEFRLLNSDANGLQYEGQVQAGTTVKHGYGRLAFPDGSYYEGYWANGKAEGKGAFKVTQTL